MTRNTIIRTHLARAAQAACRAGTVYLAGGPVGVFYALRLARLRRRLAQVSLHLHCENELHRENLRVINFELDTLVRAQQATNQAAAEFWRSLGASGEPS